MTSLSPQPNQELEKDINDDIGMVQDALKQLHDYLYKSPKEAPNYILVSAALTAANLLPDKLLSAAKRRPETESLVKSIRDSIEAFLPADYNIQERTTIDALNCVFKRIKAVEKERDELDSQLRHIALTYCGIEIGKPLEEIDEPETDVGMVAAFVEGAIDKQAYRADKAESERDSLLSSLSVTTLESGLGVIEQYKKRSEDLSRYLANKI